MWEAIATGPGISSWYVPTEVTQEAGGAMVQHFGAGPDMTVPGTVTVWEPPARVRFEGGSPAGTLAFEWLVAARDESSCVVRLINSGFADGAEWDAMYDGMADGWPLFLRNLRLHLEHFAGQDGHAMLPMAVFPDGDPRPWQRLTAALGWPADPAVGARLVTGEDAPALSGTVVDTGHNRLWLLLDAPGPGTAFVAAEGGGVSVWAYFYGAGAAALADRHQGQWQSWLTDQADAT